VPPTIKVSPPSQAAADMPPTLPASPSSYSPPVPQIGSALPAAGPRPQAITSAREGSHPMYAQFQEAARRATQGNLVNGVSSIGSTGLSPSPQHRQPPGSPGNSGAYSPMAAPPPGSSGAYSPSMGMPGTARRHSEMPQMRQQSFGMGAFPNPAGGMGYALNATSSTGSLPGGMSTPTMMQAPGQMTGRRHSAMPMSQVPGQMQNMPVGLGQQGLRR
jgi:hypothetical protein